MIERKWCPISGENSDVIFSSSYSAPELQKYISVLSEPKIVIDKSYEIRYCKKSDFYFQTWVLDNIEILDLYNPSSKPDRFFNEIENKKLHAFSHLTEEILVMRQLIQNRMPIVLDYGSSWGKWASMALAYGCDVYAVEVDSLAADFCKSRGIKLITHQQIKEYKFDFINVDQVMEHLNDPKETALNLTQSLKSGGFMKWSTPQSNTIQKQLISAERDGFYYIFEGKRLKDLEPLVHVNLFSNYSLKYLAKTVGLECVNLPFWKWFGAGQLWNMPRQLNRNLITPWKRWRALDSYLWFRKK